MRIYGPENGTCNLSGRYIKEARLKNGLSQEELSIRLQLLGLQIGQMAISRIETGKRIVPDFELPILAEALGVTTDWLLGKD
ncbi:helix-turn-helix domain-containing protein [Dysosmobacter sp.]